MVTISWTAVIGEPTGIKPTPHSAPSRFSLHLTMLTWSSRWGGFLEPMQWRTPTTIITITTITTATTTPTANLLNPPTSTWTMPTCPVYPMEDTISTTNAHLLMVTQVYAPPIMTITSHGHPRVKGRQILTLKWTTAWYVQLFYPMMNSHCCPVFLTRVYIKF